MKIIFNGITIKAYEGEILATALLAAGIKTLRQGPGDGGPRGLFCAMGSCQECVVFVNGARLESCRVNVRDGMVVETIK